MRSILSIAILLLLAGLLSCRIEGRRADTSPPAAASVDWVRTIDGWERANDWHPSFVGPPAVHPLLVATGQVLLSAFALVAAGGPADRQAFGRYDPAKT
jgi:hypothetical protein